MTVLRVWEFKEGKYVSRWTVLVECVRGNWRGDVHQHARPCGYNSSYSKESNTAHHT